MEWTGVTDIRLRPFYLFIPQDGALVRPEYEQGWQSDGDFLRVSVLGFQSHRDHFAIAS